MSPTDQFAAVVILYREQLVDAAQAASDYKRMHAKRKIKARATKEATSAADADTIADADDEIADAYSHRLLTAAIAEATKQKLYQLREQIADERTRRVSEREMDRLHMTDRHAT